MPNSGLGAQNAYMYLNRYGASHAQIMRALTQAESTGTARIGPVTVLHQGYEPNATHLDASTSTFKVNV